MTRTDVPAGPGDMQLASPGFVPSHIRSIRRVAQAGHGVSLIAAAVLVPWFNRNQWFFGDEWEFLVNRRTGLGRALFAPHNEHWSAVPVLIYRALYGLFGLRSYIPYALVLLVLHLVAVHLLWRLMNRAGVAPVLSTALAAIFAVLGAGAENLLWAFQIGFVGSVALGLLHILLVDHPGPFGRRDRMAMAVAVVALTFSGMSVTMIATSGVVVLLRRSPKDAVKTVAGPAALYLLWLVVVGHEGLNSHDRSLATLFNAPAYVWAGLSSALERFSGMPGGGPVLVLLLLVYLLRQRVVNGTLASAPTAMAIGAVTMFIISAMGRSGLGVEQATAGRYAYVAVALLLPSLGRLLSEVTSGQVSRELAALAVLALPLLHNIGELRTQSRNEADREQLIRRQLVAAAGLVASGAEVVSFQPEPAFSPDVTVESLRQFRREGALPGGVRIDEKDVLAAASQLQIALTDSPPPASRGQKAAVVNPGAVVNEKGCALIGPTGISPADIRFGEPQSISLRSPTGGELSLKIHSSVEPGLMGPTRTLLLRPVATQWLRVARAATVTLTVPGAGAMEMCGVRAQ